MPILENAGMRRDKKTFKNLVYMFINYIHISDIQYYMNLSHLWCVQQVITVKKNC